MTKDNLRIWSQVCETDPALTKEVPKGRFSLTAICAQSQRKAATNLFGPFGVGWGVDPESVDITYLDFGPEKMACYQAVLWFSEGTKTGQFPICSSIVVNPNGRLDSEWLKKVSTDALTKGLSFLGFNSDVFEGKYDDNRYVEAMKQQFASDDKTVNPKVKKPEHLDTYKSLLMTAATKGTEAFREIWSNGVEGVSKEAIAECRLHMKTTPSEQEWLQNEVKQVCQTADKNLLPSA
jgi:hypothetical protein